MILFLLVLGGYCIVYMSIVHQFDLKTFIEGGFYFGLTAVVTIGIDLVGWLFVKKAVPSNLWDIFMAIVFVVVLVLITKQIADAVNHRKEEAAMYLFKLQMFLTDFCHFLPGYYRTVTVSYSAQDSTIKVKMYVVNGKEQKELYDAIDQASDSTALTKTFFGSYVPSEVAFYCMSLLVNGRVDKDEALSYEFPLFNIRTNCFPYMMQNVQEQFSSNFKKLSDTYFSVTFQK